MSDMSNYFVMAERKGAVLLDASNFPLDEFPLMSHLKEALDSVKSGKVDLGYDDPSGSNALKKLIAEHESNYEGVNLSSTNVTVNSGGVTGAFDNIFRYLARKSAINGRREVIIPTPTYPEVPRNALYNGLDPVYVETSQEHGFQPTAEEVAKKLSPRTACIFLLSPGNPITSYINPRELEYVVGAAEDNGALVVLDAIFEEAACHPKNQRFLLNQYRGIVKIKGPSKDRPHMNDFRVGWSLSPNLEMVSELALASEVASFSVSTTLDALVRSDMKLRLGRYYQDNKVHPPEDFESQYPGLEKYNSELAYFFDKIKEGLDLSLGICKNHPAVAEVHAPEAGNMIFIKLDKSRCAAKGIISDKDLFSYILEKTRVGVTPGHVFMTDPKEIWFRATMSKNPKIFARHLAEVLESLK